MLPEERAIDVEAANERNAKILAMSRIPIEGIPNPAAFAKQKKPRRDKGVPRPKKAELAAPGALTPEQATRIRVLFATWATAEQEAHIAQDQAEQAHNIAIKYLESLQCGQ